MERTKKEKNIKKLFNRSLSYIILVLGVFAFCYSINQITNYAIAKRENHTLEKQLSALKEENEHLEITNEKLKDKGVLVRHFEKERIKDYNRITIGSHEEMETFLTKVKEILTEQ